MKGYNKLDGGEARDCFIMFRIGCHLKSDFMKKLKNQELGAGELLRDYILKYTYGDQLDIED